MARILVLDDARSTCELVKEMLSAERHVLYLAESASRARELLEENPIDLLITDIYMPDEDGLQVIAHTRKSHPGVVIIAMSSKSGPWDMLAPARFLGASFAMHKPFTREMLLSVIGQALAQRPGQMRVPQ